MDLDHTPLTGIIAGRYDSRREAGRGGMAVVFLAWDLPHNRPVALKVLRPAIGMVLGHDRFLREIRIAAHLAHPHILGLLDSGVAEVQGGVSLPYYVMPFLEGQSLADRLAREPRLPIDEALRIAAEVADALQYAHGRGLVHRDIKPANILLQEGHALVADFGIARMLADQTDTATGIGLAIGTPRYMSPEQFAASASVDGRSDVYSLGCVLYEMLSGEPPFTGATPHAINARQLEPPRDIRAVRPDLPSGVAQAITHALARDPAERYPSAAEFRNTLNRLRSGTGEVAPRAPRNAVLRRVGASALAALLVLLVIWRLGPPDGTAAASAPARILVTWFQDLTGGGLRAEADAITEALIDQLHAVPDLTVTAAAVVAPFRDAPLDTLRTRFPADRVVTGTLAQRGNSTLLAARIVDPESGQQLAARAWTTGSSVVVIELVEDLSAFIRETLWEQRERAARRAQVSDPEAWRLLEQARVLCEEAEDAVAFRADRAGFKALDRADSWSPWKSPARPTGGHSSRSTSGRIWPARPTACPTRQPGEGLEVFARGLEWVEGDELRHQPEGGARRPGSRCGPENPDLTTVEWHPARHRAHQCRLAGPVRADQGEDPPDRDLERHFLQGDAGSPSSGRGAHGQDRVVRRRRGSGRLGIEAGTHCLNTWSSRPRRKSEEGAK